MPDTLIEEKIERALQTVLQAAATGIDSARIYKGHDEEHKELNSIICQCASAVEDRECPGNWNVRARVGTFGDPDAQEDTDTPLDDHNSQAGTVSDALMMDDLGSSLSAAVDGLTVYDPPILRRKIPDIEGRRWVKWLELELYAHCTDA